MRVATSVALVGFVAMPAQAQLFADDDARKAIIDLRAKLAASEEQARTRQRFQNFRQLPAEDRERLRKAQQRFRQLSPEQREQLRQRWQNMTPEQRQKLRERRHRPH